jgi:hypothetical protein
VARAARWLDELGGYVAEDNTLAALSRCQSREEVEFLVAFISAPGWFLLDESTFADQMWTLTPRPEIAGHTLSALLANRHESEAVAFEIVEDRLVGRDAPRNGERAKAIAAAIGGDYRAVPAKEVPAAAASVHKRLEVIADRVPRNSTFRFSMNMAPGLVWKPLPDDFEFQSSITKSVGPRARQQQLAHWLRGHRVELPSHLLPLVALCDWHASVKFAPDSPRR